MLKAFKDIPIYSLEQILPDKRIKISKLDQVWFLKSFLIIYDGRLSKYHIKTYTINTIQNKMNWCENIHTIYNSALGVIHKVRAHGGGSQPMCTLMY